MTTAELLDAVAKDGSFTKSSTAATMKSLVNCMAKELQAGGEVVLQGLGKFTVKNVPARTARNPITGDPVNVPAKRKVVFKAHKALKDAVQ